jgi:hypothetical protein
MRVLETASVKRRERAGAWVPSVPSLGTLGIVLLLRGLDSTAATIYSRPAQRVRNAYAANPRRASGADYIDGDRLSVNLTGRSPSPGERSEVLLLHTD